MVSSLGGWDHRRTGRNTPDRRLPICAGEPEALLVRPNGQQALRALLPQELSASWPEYVLRHAAGLRGIVVEMVGGQPVLLPIFAGVFLAYFLIFHAISKEAMVPIEDARWV